MPEDQVEQSTEQPSNQSAEGSAPVNEAAPSAEPTAGGDTTPTEGTETGTDAGASPEAGTESAPTLDDRIRFAAETSGKWSTEEIDELVKDVGPEKAAKFLGKHVDALARLAEGIEVPDDEAVDTAKPAEKKGETTPKQSETVGPSTAAGAPLSDEFLKGLEEEEGASKTLEALKTLNQTLAADRAKFSAKLDELTQAVIPARFAADKIAVHQDQENAKKFESLVQRIDVGRYGKEGARTPQQEKDCIADAKLARAIRTVHPTVSPEEAMIAAHAYRTKKDTRSDAVKGVQAEIKARTKGFSIPPRMGGTAGKATPDNETPEQTRARKVAYVRSLTASA